jgi:hypothetical protein
MNSQQTPSRIEYWPIERLVEYPRNPRKNDAAVDRMCGWIREFSFNIPCFVRSDGEVVDGNLRLEAARNLSLTEIPVILYDQWTPAQVKAFRILVNRPVTGADREREQTIGIVDHDEDSPWDGEGEGKLIDSVDDKNARFEEITRFDDLKEVPEYVPMGLELVQVAKYWQNVWLDTLFFMFLVSQWGGSQLRLADFAQGRLKCIAAAIGDDVVVSVMHEVNEEFGKGCDPRAWDCFRENLPLPEKVADKYARGEKPTDEDWDTAVLAKRGLITRPRQKSQRTFEDFHDGL